MSHIQIREADFGIMELFEDVEGKLFIILDW